MIKVRIDCSSSTTHRLLIAVMYAPSKAAAGARRDRSSKDEGTTLFSLVDVVNARSLLH